MHSCYKNYIELSETLSTSELYNKNKNDYYEVAEKQSKLLKELAYINKKRIKEGNDMAIQIQVNYLYI